MIRNFTTPYCDISTIDEKVNEAIKKIESKNNKIIDVRIIANSENKIFFGQIIYKARRKVKEVKTTDKEQIMIDGVDISGCLFYQSNFEEDYDVRIKHFCSNWHNSCESSNNSNCYFKQLARKTQECEELKERLVRTEEDLKYQCVDCMNAKSDSYRKALDEIEDITQNHIINDFSNWNMGEISDDIVADYVTANCKQILDIINKVKEE